MSKIEHLVQGAGENTVTEGFEASSIQPRDLAGCMPRYVIATCK